MLSAIVYNSMTGSCKHYAELLSARLHIPCHPFHDSYVRSNGEVLYIGWVKAGRVVGYKSAASRMNIVAVAAVGMSPIGPGSIDVGRRANKIPDSVAYFPLQGSFNLNQLPKGMQLIMRCITKGIAKKLSKKGNLTAQEQATYKMATTGAGDPAEWDVSAIVDWCHRK